jgi:2-alkenal reductase
MKRSYAILLAITVMVLALLSCQALNVQGGEPVQVAPPAFPTAPVVVSQPSIVSAPPGMDLVASQDTLISLYERIHSGVVSLRGSGPDGNSQGSGFVYDTEGHIVTNFHVVQNQEDLEVAFPSGIKVRGTVIGTDLDSDLAVVKVDLPASELMPLALGDSSLLKVGQSVVAIGNPFGLEGTMTIGIISGLGRTLESLHSTPDGGTFSAADVIQTDAAINPGNSGGPLINLNGEVVGVNEAIRTNTYNAGGQPVNSGVGFAVSVNIVKRVVPFLILNGHYNYPYLGITSLPDISLLVQETLGLPRSTGVYITGIVSDSPAERAGLVPGEKSTDITGLLAGGDLIIAIDDRPVYTFNDLISYLIQYKSPGDVVILTVIRDGQEIQLNLTLDARPRP